MFQKVLLLCLLGQLNFAKVNSQEMITRIATEYFEQVTQIAEEDAGKFWGQNILSPLMFVDVETKVIFTNSQDSLHSLTAVSGTLYKGVLPQNVAIANTSVKWNGVQWTMLMWSSLSEKEKPRNRLIFHELFHSLQVKLGLPMKRPSCDHLDTKEGRILFRLELAALSSALSKPIQKRKEDIFNALCFRQYRYLVFPGSSLKEKDIGWNEGLAEYTGVMLSKINDSINKYLIRRLDSVDLFYNSFMLNAAYITGPAYGVLLADIDKTWQQRVKESDSIGNLVTTAYKLKKLSDTKKQMSKEKMKYGYTKIANEENDKENEKLAKISELKNKFYNSPTLRINLTDKSSGGFSPDKIILTEGEIFYENFELIDDFGKISINKGGLVNYKLRQVIVSLPKEVNIQEKIIKANDWELSLNADWRIVADKNSSNYIIRKKE
jgi:hypothetical protein